MCGRYAFYSPDEAVRELFRVHDLPPLKPRYNIAPTQFVPVVRADANGDRELVTLHWGLLPHWAKDRAVGSRMINARVETVDQKPAFKSAFQERRCLLVADGWYEWQRLPGGKQPWFIRRKYPGPFAFAGLWERWKDPANGWPLESCTIITTAAAEDIRHIHHRMPYVLNEGYWDNWLDPDAPYTEGIARTLRVLPPETFEFWPVSTRVNAPQNEGPDLIERL